MCVKVNVRSRIKLQAALFLGSKLFKYSFYFLKNYIVIDIQISILNFYLVRSVIKNVKYNTTKPVTTADAMKVKGAPN